MFYETNEYGDVKCNGCDSLIKKGVPYLFIDDNDMSYTSLCDACIKEAQELAK